VGCCVVLGLCLLLGLCLVWYSLNHICGSVGCVWFCGLDLRGSFFRPLGSGGLGLGVGEFGSGGRF